jgi:hypothetical protein
MVAVRDDLAGIEAQRVMRSAYLWRIREHARMRAAGMPLTARACSEVADPWVVAAVAVDPWEAVFGD